MIETARLVPVRRLAAELLDTRWEAAGEGSVHPT